MSYQHVSRLRTVGEEFNVVRISLRYAVGHWQAVSAEPEAVGLRLEAFRESLTRLEDTYKIRLFSAFEAILRNHWILVKQPNQPVPDEARVLINRVASKHSVVPDDCHRMREHRNEIVHADGNTAEVIAFADMQAVLNRFLSAIPDPK